ncbi:hypothetical protein [Salinimicrobium gaetbulicola]|uniref:YD repeat-containing protein n=1 Tax=Salinimicrobium gaetbulicola TaxID=999702 RepID=A0ABW3IF89_9FLAO
MKTQFLIIAIISLTLFTSCSTETMEESGDRRNLVHKEYVRDNYNLEYRYNESDLLVQINDIFLEEDINSVINFKYDSNNNVIENTYRSLISGYESVTLYQYDNQGRLVSSEMTSNVEYIGPTSLKFSYDQDIITVTSNNDEIISLKVNSSGLISEMFKYGSKSTFAYDAHGNLIQIQTYSPENVLEYTHSYTYDDKLNPFYGQLNSIYLIQFLDIMGDLSYGEDLLFPYQGYEFSYLNNNITEVKSNGEIHGTWSYEYDGKNYPVQVQGNRRSNIFTFDILYK